LAGGQKNRSSGNTSTNFNGELNLFIRGERVNRKIYF